MGSDDYQEVDYGELQCFLQALLTPGDLVYCPHNQKVVDGWRRQVWRQTGDQFIHGPKAVRWAELWCQVGCAARTSNASRTRLAQSLALAKSIQLRVATPSAV